MKERSTQKCLHLKAFNWSHKNNTAYEPDMPIVKNTRKKRDSNSKKYIKQ